MRFGDRGGIERPIRIEILRNCKDHFYTTPVSTIIFSIEHVFSWHDLTHDYRPLERMWTFEQVVIENES